MSDQTKPAPSHRPRSDTATGREQVASAAEIGGGASASALAGAGKDGLSMVRRLLAEGGQDGLSEVQRFAPAQQHQTLRALQRTIGNAAVARQLDPGSPVLRRTPETEADGADRKPQVGAVGQALKQIGNHAREFQRQIRLHSQARDLIDRQANTAADAEAAGHTGIVFVFEYTGTVLDLVELEALGSGSTGEARGNSSVTAAEAKTRLESQLLTMLRFGPHRLRLEFAFDEQRGLVVRAASRQELPPPATRPKRSVGSGPDRSQLEGELGDFFPPADYKNIGPNAAKLGKEAVVDIVLPEVAGSVIGGPLGRVLGGVASKGFPRLLRLIGGGRQQEVAKVFGRLGAGEAEELDRLVKKIDGGEQLTAAEGKHLKAIAGKLDEAAGVTASASPIGFAPGSAKSALVPERLQHASRHLTDEGILPNWSKATGQKFVGIAERILENPTATFDHKLGGKLARGFAGTVDGKTVVVFVFSEGPLAGKVATSIVPDAAQAAKWGL
jgi:hypothetical protein